MDYERDNAAEWDLPDHDDDDDPQARSNSMVAPDRRDWNVPSPSLEILRHECIPRIEDDIQTHASHHGKEQDDARTILSREDDLPVDRLSRLDLEVAGLSESLETKHTGLQGASKPSRRQPAGSDQKPRHDFRWPKVRPENDWAGRQEGKVRKEERRKATNLTKTKAYDAIYGHKGSYILPDDRIDVDAVAKTAGELADFLDCHIVFDQDHAIINVTAENFETVQKALDLVRAKLRSIVATENYRLFLLESPCDGVQTDSAHVQIRDASAQGAQPKVAGLSLKSETQSLNERLPVILPSTLHQVDTDDESRRLLHRRGQVQMRLTFGGLVLHRYQWPKRLDTQPLDKFVRSLHNPRTEASLYMLSPAAKLYERVASAARFFVPWSSTIDDLRNTSPFFVGRFVWPRASEGKPPWIFEVATEPIDIGTNAPPATRIRRWLPPPAPKSRLDMEIFMTQMNGGISCAWQIVSDPDMDQEIKYPKQLTAQQVQMINMSDYADAASKGLMMFDPRRSGAFFYRQRTVWRFRLRIDRRYVFDLIRYDAYADFRGSQNLDRNPSETRWNACVYNEEWDWAFAGNKAASTEEGAKWSPSLDTFFPGDALRMDSTDGFQRFVHWVRGFLEVLNNDEREIVRQRSRV